MTPTYSTRQVARLCSRSVQWVRQMRIDLDLGYREGHGWRFTAGDLATLLEQVDPDETRGRPGHRTTSHAEEAL